MSNQMYKHISRFEYFNMIMSDIEVCKRFLETVFPGRKVETISYKAKPGEDRYGVVFSEETRRGVRVDVRFENEEETNEIEILCDEYGDKKKDELSSRLRYYSNRIEIEHINEFGIGKENTNNVVIFVGDYIDQIDYEPMHVFDLEGTGYMYKAGRKAILLNTASPYDMASCDFRELYDYMEKKVK